MPGKWGIIDIQIDVEYFFKQIILPTTIIGSFVYIGYYVLTSK